MLLAMLRQLSLQEPSVKARRSLEAFVQAWPNDADKKVGEDYLREALTSWPVTGFHLDTPLAVCFPGTAGIKDLYSQRLRFNQAQTERISWALWEGIEAGRLDPEAKPIVKGCRRFWTTWTGYVHSNERLLKVFDELGRQRPRVFSTCGTVVVRWENPMDVSVGSETLPCKWKVAPWIHHVSRAQNLPHDFLESKVDLVFVCSNQQFQKFETIPRSPLLRQMVLQADTYRNDLTKITGRIATYHGVLDRLMGRELTPEQLREELIEGESRGS
jgi:hypothetical protein